MTGVTGWTAIAGLVGIAAAPWVLIATGRLKFAGAPRRAPAQATAGTAADKAPAVPAGPPPGGPRRPASWPPRNPKLAEYAAKRPREHGRFVALNGGRSS